MKGMKNVNCVLKLETSSYQDFFTIAKLKNDYVGLALM